MLLKIQMAEVVISKKLILVSGLIALISIIFIFKLDKSKKKDRSLASLNRFEGSPLRNDDPTAFLMWIRNNGNRNKSIEDIICCMPEKYRSSFKLVHTSKSAQASRVHSPRILFGNLKNDGIMFLVSGGDPDLPQANSIEVMFDNPRIDELELYDIEFSEVRRY